MKFIGVFQQLADAYRGKPVAFPRSAPAPPPVPQTFENTWTWLLNELGWKAAKAGGS